MITPARVLVMIAVVALGPVTPALAGGSLLQSANRLAQQVGREVPIPASSAGLDAPSRTLAAQATPAENGMSRRKKVFIAIVAVLGVAGGMYAIDHRVEDNTPSSKGTRKD